MADDNALRAWVRNLDSGIAFWAGRWSKAAALAAESRQYARSPASVMRASTAQARALARLGDAEGVRNAILDAEQVDDVAELDTDRGVARFTLANRTRCAGTALLWLGDHAEAERHLAEALSRYHRDEPAAYAHIAVTRADLASARLHLGDVDGAVEALEPILSLSHERRLAGVTRRVGGIRKQLAESRFRNSPAAADLAVRLEGVALLSLTLPPKSR